MNKLRRKFSAAFKAKVALEALQERDTIEFLSKKHDVHRRTICYSKNKEVHDNVIGMYIERYYFKTGLFRNAA